ncbi:MAG: molybdopterin molybdotransferase MoeA, partial [Planctomycetota bacterium]
MAAMEFPDALRVAVDAARACGTVEAETVPRPDAAGRVLASAALLDRDSPSCDVSAMDGFAVRRDELAAGPVRLAGYCRIGEEPATLAAGEALAIYTGCPVPTGADTVARLEIATADGDTLTLNEGEDLVAGADIRRQGENGRGGDELLPAGRAVTPAAASALATVGLSEVPVFRRLRVGVLTTGNELLDADDPATPPAWKIRNSNGPALASMFGGQPWVGAVGHHGVPDDFDATVATIEAAIAEYDAVALTGGVSKGAFDFVPKAIETLGGTIHVHGVKARPGRPTLIATASGKPVVGLPGNPLSVLSVARRLLVPVLRVRAG